MYASQKFIDYRSLFILWSNSITWKSLKKLPSKVWNERNNKSYKTRNTIPEKFTFQLLKYFMCKRSVFVRIYPKNRGFFVVWAFRLDSLPSPSNKREIFKWNGKTVLIWIFSTNLILNFKMKMNILKKTHIT